MQDKICSQQGSLTEHQRIYSGDRPYSCDMYNKFFIIYIFKITVYQNLKVI